MTLKPLLTRETRVTIKPRRLNSSKKTRYRSGLEERIAKELTADGVDFKYETVVLKFTQPAKDRKYTPDFILPNGIIIEAKGLLELKDRQKHLWVKEAHPELDIRFVFTRVINTITKRSKTTYGDWATKNGFKWANKSVPKEWIEE